MEYKISVIVPVYNVKDYLEECVESICKQTYDNLEIILVDDGSNDGSEKMCDDYARKDRRVHVIHKENGGLSSARNAGINAATGEWISMIDSDDFICLEFYQIICQAIQRTDCPMICIEDICFVDGYEEKVYQKWKNDNQRYLRNIEQGDVQIEIYQWKEMVQKTLYRHIKMDSAQLKVYHKSLFDKISFPIGRKHEDVATTWKFMKEAKKIAFIPLQIYAYRNRTGSIMNAGFNEHTMDCLWIEDILNMELSNIYPELNGAVMATVFRLDRVAFARMEGAPMEAKKAVWESIIRIRNDVIQDKNVRKGDRLLAICTYLGQDCFWAVLQFFEKMLLIKKRLCI